MIFYKIIRITNKILGRKTTDELSSKKTLQNVQIAPEGVSSLGFHELYEVFSSNTNNLFPCLQIHPNHQNIIDSFESLFLGYDDELLYKSWIQKVAPWTMVSYGGLVSLADQIKYCEQNGIEGDFVETGTCRGGSFAIMALANLHYGQERRTLHGFDSFQGIPWPDKNKDDQGWIEKHMMLDFSACDGKVEGIGRLVAPREDFDLLIREIINYPEDYIKVHEGWFQDTIPLAVKHIEKIAVLRLDADLYESTMICLKYLYPLIVPSGFIIIDDWCLKGARCAVEDYLASINLKPYIHRVDGSVRYFIK